MTQFFGKPIKISPTSYGEVLPEYDTTGKLIVREQSTQNPISYPPPPDMPDTTELSEQYNMNNAVFNPRRYAKDFASELNQSDAIAARAANNASSIYSNRLMRAGINPVAAGAVRAQVLMQGRRNTADIKQKQREFTTELLTNRAKVNQDIAAALASIRANYSQTLADYNMRAASLKQNEKQINVDSYTKLRALQMQEQQAEADRILQELQAAAIAKKSEEPAMGFWNKWSSGVKSDFSGNAGALEIFNRS